MRIDEFLRNYDFTESHEITINASAEKVYEELQKLDFSNSFCIRCLFACRGLKSGTFQQIKSHFILLDEKPPEEIVLGLIARPWKLRADILPCTKNDFINFDRPEYAKIAWNFSFHQLENRTRVITETRIQCTDGSSKKKFGIYWFFVGFFSGLVRKEMLKLLKKQTELK